MAGTASAIIMGKANPSRAPNSQSAPSRHVDKLRVAQIGMQGHSGIVLNGLSQTKECELVAVARSLPDEQIEDLKNYSCWSKQTRIYEDYRKMLDETKPDIVAVFTPFVENGRANIEAARRGCHVISEKPLAVTLEELDELRRQRDKNNIRITALLPTRLNPMFAAAHKAVKDGLVGEPVLISAQKILPLGERPAGVLQVS